MLINNYCRWCQLEEKCLQSLQSVFNRAEPRVSLPFIRALAPCVLEKIRKYVPLSMEQSTAEHSFKELSSNDHLAVLQEAFKCLEVLLTVAQPEKSERIRAVEDSFSSLK